MNYSGKFAFNAAASHSGGPVDIDPVPHRGDADAITVSDAHLLFTGDFNRSGVNLIISKDGRELVVEEYFKGEKRAALASPDGASLSGDIVNALTGHVQYAQASGAPDAAKVIGHVTKLAGSATVIRNGVSIVLNMGDNVNKGDVVQSGSGSQLGITFIDGTVFALSSNARMVLDEMVYDPNGTNNSSLLSLVQGTISFVAGETAKHGDMKVTTPVATMGIRGTAVLVEIGFEVPVTDPNTGMQSSIPVKFQVLQEPNGTVGSYVLYAKNDLTYSNPIATISRAGEVTSYSANGNLSVAQVTQLAPEAKAIIDAALGQYFPNYTPAPNNANPQGTAPNGSTPATPVPQQQQEKAPLNPTGTPTTIPINVPVPAPTPTNPDATIIKTVEVTITPNTPPTINVAPIVNVITPVVEKATFKIQDQVTITDPDSSNPAFNDVAVPYVPGSGRILSAVGPAYTPTGLELTRLVILDPATGDISYDSASFAFLKADDHVVFTIGFNISSGPTTVPETLTVSIVGVNDAPVITGATVGVSQGSAVVLSPSNFNVIDPDDTNLTFAATNVTHGKFQIRTGDNWVDAATFTSADLAAGHVRFVHDGSASAPTFSIQANDGEALDNLSDTIAGTVSFTSVNNAPTITGASFTVSEGGNVPVTLASIGVTDPDSSNFTFTVTNVTHGAFQRTTDGINWTAATTFTTVDLAQNHVRFVHDGGLLASTFSIQANDGADVNNLSDVFAGSITYTPVPGAILGDEDNNPLTGTAGNDAFQGFGGDDLIDGLTGVDRAVYADATGGITVDLAAGTVSGPGVGNDTLTGIEAIQGSSFVDRYSALGFAGVSGVPGVPMGFNSFEGMGGDDEITGTVNGQGQALTRVVYSSATAAVAVDFAAGTATGDASVGTDHFNSGVNAVIGSGFGDILLGSNNPNGTYEQYEGRGGNDLIDGRGGYDFATYNNAPATTSGILVNLAAGTVFGDASVGTDTLRSVEAVRGTNFADTYDARNFGALGFLNPATNNVGSSGTFNNFDGVGGNDTIIGNGNTRIQYSNALAAVTVDIALGTAHGTAPGDVSNTGTDTFSGVNAVMGSMFCDTVLGSGNNENFMGLAGDDDINGRGGFDVAQYNNMTYTTGGISVDFAAGTVIGDASTGTDTLRSIEGVQGTNFDDTFVATGFGLAGALNIGDNGNFNQFEGLDGDDLITGNGNTRVIYANAAAGVTVDIEAGMAQDTADYLAVTTNDLAGIGKDTLTGGVSGVTGSNFADTLLGGENLPGTVEQFEGRGGNDRLDGRGGFDQAIYNVDPNVTTGITVHMAAGTVDGDALTVGHDTLISIESIVGTRFNDVYDAADFTGGDSGPFNEFQGLGGDDQITGNGYTQISYFSAAAGVTVDLVAGTAQGTASGDIAVVGHDTIIGGVNVVGGSNFNDILSGNSDANELDGWGGNDRLDGRGGSDLLFGGTGADTFVYAAGGGADTIADFRHSDSDKIDLTGIAGVHSLADLNLTQSGSDTVIQFGGGNSLTLSGVTAASLVAEDFVFTANHAPQGTYDPVQPAGVVEDGTLASTVTVSNSDVDAGDVTHYDMTGWSPTALADDYSLGNAYGNAVFNTVTGELTFQLDNNSAAVQGLGAGDHVDVDVTVVVRDQSGASATTTVTFGVDGVNDAATVGGDVTGGVFEDEHFIPVPPASGTIVVNDVDDGTLTVQDVDSNESYFLPVEQAALTGVYGDFTFDAGSGHWTYQLVHDRVNGLAAGEIKHDTLTVTTADGTPQVIDITVTGTNDAPVLDADDVTVTYEMGGTAVAAAANVAVSDVDNADYNGGSLTAWVNGGYDGDILSIAENQYIQVTGNIIMFDAGGDGDFSDSVAIGTRSDDIYSLTIDLNGDATSEAIAYLTQAIQFQSTSSQAGTRTVVFALTDGDGTDHLGQDTGWLSATVEVTTPANDAPVTSAVTLDEIAEDSGARLITQAELLANASDVDSPSLTATDLAISSGSGTLIDNQDGTWTYTPASNEAGSVSFSYQVTDGDLSAKGTATLDITPVADAPAFRPFANTVADDFNGAELDAAKWQVYLPTIDIVESYDPSVTQIGGVVQIHDRGILQTVAGFTPTSVTPLHVTFTWTFSDPGDYFVVTDRTDGATESNFGGAANGIDFVANWRIGDLGALLIVDHASGDSVRVDASLSAGVTYDVSITDDGVHQTFVIIDHESGQPVASATSDFASAPAGSLVTFTNREGNDGQHTDTIDNLSISNAYIAPAYEALEDGTVVLTGLTAVGDTDGSESLALRLSGFPVDSTFSVGALGSGADAGVWLISASELDWLGSTPLTMTPPPNYNGDFTLHLDAVVTDTALLPDGVAIDTKTFTNNIAIMVDAVNDVPTGSVTISGTAQENQVLTASNALVDADGLGTISYQWQRDGVNIGATGSTYTLGDADVGHTIDVVASYTDGHGTLESVASAATAAVTNVNDVPTGSVTISGTAQENQVLTASNTLADADGLGAISYQWQRDGVDIGGATGITYTLGNTDVGHAIDLVAHYTDEHGTAESVASAQTTQVAGVGIIIGDNNSNTLTGTAGNDALQGFGGNDSIIGLTGIDRAVYTDASGGITADLAAGTVSGSGVGTDTLTGIEAIQGSKFIDHYSAAGFTGDAEVPGVPVGFNSFEGMGGDDLIVGSVNVQGEVLTRVVYSNATGAVTVDFAAATTVGTDHFTGTAIGDLSVGTDHFTNVNAVIGSGFADTLRGSNNANGTYEQYDGRAGNDLIDGRGGFDFAVYNNDPATLSGITVNLGAGIVTGDASIGTDTLRSVESVRGTNFADTYDARNFGVPGFLNVGSYGTFNNFDGVGGDDTIYGNGNTRIQYTNSTGAVTVDIVLGKAHGTAADDAAGTGTDTFSGVNAVIGSMFDDAISGSDNNETFMGLAGDDTIDGRGGFDTVQYNNMTYTTGGISVDFAIGRVIGDASTGADTLRSIESIQGTAFNDVYNAVGFGDASHFDPTLNNVGNNGTYNQFEGLDGDDQITGNGNTRAVYLNAAAGVTVDLVLGTGKGTAGGDIANVGTDTFIGGVNGAVGSNFTDMLLGSNNASGTVEQFDGRGGNDTLNGRGGFDQATYANDQNVTTGITVNMFAGTVDGDATVGHDALISIESVIGTRFNDVYNAANFTGGSFGTFNEFQGYGGDDRITGNGNTQLGYSNATSGVTFDLATGNAAGDASVGHDTFTGVISVIGSNFDDTISGSSASEFFNGGSGNDFIKGRGGNDTMTGGAGADTFVYATGDGADQITDFLRGQGDKIDVTGVSSVLGLSDIASHAAQQGSDTVITFSPGNSITLQNVALGSLVASDFVFAAAGSTPNGNANNNSLVGTVGADTLSGLAGNDRLQGLADNDLLDGGLGFDRAVYTDATGAVIVDLAQGKAFGAGVGSDTLVSIEGAVGSDFADIFDAFGFTGSNNGPGSPDGFNEFEGRGGNDAIIGAINGQGQALTRVSYVNATAAVTVDIAAGTADGDASVGHDNFSNVSAAWGSGFNDILRGSDNIFASFELFDGRGGDDFIDGRGGYDRVDYNNDPGTTGITVHLAAGTVTGDATVGTDTLRAVEAVRGTNLDDYYDALGFGESGALNVGSSGTFNDFSGMGGSDTVIGNGNTRLNYTNAIGPVTVDLETSAIGTTTAITVVGTASGSGEGADNFTGVNAVHASTFADTLLGSSFDNTFTGNAGNDIIDGRGGFDISSYNNLTLATGGVIVHLAAGFATGDASIGTDTLRSIEGIQGTNFADMYDATNYGSGATDPDTGHPYANVGSNGTFNQFEGLAGDDTITGNGNTRLVFTNATAGVTVDLATGNVNGNASVGHDTITGGVNSVFGSNFADTISGSSANEIFNGGAGNDSLTGGAGSDQFIFRFNSGNDTVTDFAHGTDTIDIHDYATFAQGDSSSFAAWIAGAAVEQQAGGTLIHLDANNSIMLSSVAKASLSMNDFILHPAGQ